MDNHGQENIDELFKGRFQDLKDHSVDPASEWGAFEGQWLSASASQVSAIGASASSWSLAASFASIVALSSLTTQDQSKHQEAQYYPTASIEEVSSVQSTLEESAANWATMVWSQQREIEQTWASVESVEPNRATNYNESGHIVISDHDEGAVNVPNLEAANLLTDTRGDKQILTNSNDGILVEAVSQDDRSSLEFMTKIGWAAQTAGVNERNLVAEKGVHTSFRAHSYFFRGGARIGYGESNSVNNPAKWALNGVASIGYSYALNAKTFITFEAGMYNRSGNGIERSKDKDLQPLISTLINSFGEMSDEEISLRRDAMNIRESVVATSLTYFHMPIAIHVNLNTNTNTFVGGYADYLLGVRNESYMVYNSEDYVTTDFGIGDESSKEGLNNWRVGLMAGIEQRITDHISADFRALLPITSIYDASSDFYMHDQPNQPVDFQASLKFEI